MMQSQLERELRDAWASRLTRKFGLTPARVSLGMAAGGDGQQTLQARIPHGRPVIIQDGFGNTRYLPGLDGPVGE